MNPNPADNKKNVEDVFDLGFTNDIYILPENCKKSDVILLEGPPSAFKKTLAFNFLIRGLVRGENVLLIELSDKISYIPGQKKRVSLSVLEDLRKTLYLNCLCQKEEINKPLLYYRQVSTNLNHPDNTYYTHSELIHKTLQSIHGNDINAWYETYKKLNPDKKQEVYEKLFCYATDSNGQELNKEDSKLNKRVSLYNNRFRLTNVAFKSGFILPEEFIQEIRDILLTAARDGSPIKRIVFLDLELLGVSYPLLKFSKTAGDLFLTAFVHIIRNYQNISLLMTGTTGQYSQADEMIGRARALADVVLKTSVCDVFGNRYVVIEGEGLTTPLGGPNQKNGKEYGEYSPGVIIPRNGVKTSTFDVNMNMMEGLVGFEAKHLHRPGVVFYAFEEGRIQHQYNENIENTLSYTMGLPRKRMNEVFSKEAGKQEKEAGADTRVYVESFKASESEALHNSLTQLIGKPLNKTIICAVDEFALSKEMNKESIAENAFVDLGPFKIEQDLHLIGELKYFTKPTKHYIWPYYVNVLFLVYRTKYDKTPFTQSLEESGFKSWTDIHSFLKEYNSELPPNELGFKSWMEVNSYATIMQNAQKPISFPENSGFKSWADIALFAEKMQNDIQSIQLPHKSGFNSWTEVYSFAQKMQEAIQKYNKSSVKPPLFEYFRYANETLSCVLLDTLKSGYKNSSLDPKGSPSGSPSDCSGGCRKQLFKEILFESKQLNEKQEDEIWSLYQLLSRSGRNETKNLTSLEDEVDSIDTQGGVFLLWYSQIRELLEKKPFLQNQLQFCALPGGGFRGDWYIGISKGSVSKQLGKNILQMLCSQREQYNRFSKGVGLPIFEEYYKEDNQFYSWPGGEHMPVNQIKDIYEKSNTRSDIPNYPEFRNILSMICRHMTQKDRSRKDVIKNVNRLYSQIQLFHRE